MRLSICINRARRRGGALGLGGIVPCRRVGQARLHFAQARAQPRELGGATLGRRRRGRSQRGGARRQRAGGRRGGLLGGVSVRGRHTPAATHLENAALSAHLVFERARVDRARLEPEKLLELAAPWAPYRTVAVWYLWRHLDAEPVEY